ncbi:MAG: hypothetical protein KDJ38_13620 [Gammaproteobacteria bacterium]|nr:hypothetical protein [Gammaproteobacteria bacterium]
MSPEGRLHFYLEGGASGLSVRLDSERPVDACRVFEGKPVADVLEMMPLLFNICGQAQSVTAIRAIESARQTPAAVAVERQRDILVALESLREHLWRFLISWPALCGLAPQTDKLAGIHQRMMALQTALNPGRCLTTKPGLEQTPLTGDALLQDWQTVNSAIGSVIKTGAGGDHAETFPWLWPLTDPVGFNTGELSMKALPELAEDRLAQAFASQEDFAARPQLDGEVFETGPWARQRNHPALTRVKEQYGLGIYTRLVARLVEIAGLQAQVTQILQGEQTETGQRAGLGIAQLEAVRGRLIHAVGLDGDRISRYRILAPTEWNFHPQGIAMRLLASLDTGPGLKNRAEWVIQAIDPCVGYDIHLDEALC